MINNANEIGSAVFYEKNNLQNSKQNHKKGYS